MKLHPGLQWRNLFSISSLVKISMISLILSFKLSLNSLVWSKHFLVFLKSLCQSVAIFRNFQKMFGNAHVTLKQILENFRKSLESGRTFSENCQKHHHQYVYIIKRTLHISSKIWILCSCGKNTWSHSFAVLNHWLMILFLPLQHQIHINILFIFCSDQPDKTCPLQDNDESSFLQHGAASQGHCAEQYCEKNMSLPTPITITHLV